MNDMSEKKIGAARARRQRNSSVELLRILAMLMITTNHFVRLDLGFRDGEILFNRLPMTMNKAIVETLFIPFGKIGVIAFFCISAWFLSSGKPTLRQGLRRAWMLEREVLFWSLALLAVTFALAPERFGMGLIAHSLLPVTTGVWWYVTAYVIFLLLQPFLTVGLQALGQRAHLQLFIVCLLLWSVVGGLIPAVTLQMPNNTFVGFIDLYVLLTYVRWYRPQPSRRAAVALLVSGIMLTVVMVSAAESFLSLTGKGVSWPTRMANTTTNLTDVLMGAGLFFLFLSGRFESKTVDWFASHAFGVYLITVYPADLVWSFFPSNTFYQQTWYAAYVIGSVAAIYLMCALADTVRKMLFSLVIDRNPGRWFDLFYDRVLSKMARYQLLPCACHDSLAPTDVVR